MAQKSEGCSDFTTEAGLELNAAKDEGCLQLGAADRTLTVAALECLGETSNTPAPKPHLNGFILLSRQSYGKHIYAVCIRGNATNMQDSIQAGHTPTLPTE